MTTDQHGGDIRRYVFYFLMPLVSIVLTLLLAEWCMALFRPVPPSLERVAHYVPDNRTGYRIKPHHVGAFHNGVPIRINQFGQRGDEVTLTKKTNTAFRILVIGDSFTFGSQVAQEFIYPQLLKELLSEAVHVWSSIEIVNAGVGGWDPFQYAQYYEYYGQRFMPDLVLVGLFVGNDAYNQATTVEQLPTVVMGRRVSRRVAERFTTRLKIFLTEHSHLARLVLLKGGGIDIHTRKRCDQFPDKYLALQKRRLPCHLKKSAEQETRTANCIDQLIRIKTLTDEKGIPLVVAFLPDENQVNPALQKVLIPDDRLADYDFRMPQDLLADILKERNVLTIDLLDEFLMDSRCLYLDDSHWNETGHRVAAAGIARELAPLIDQQPRPH